MDEASRNTVEDARDGIVALLRTIADRLHALNTPEAHRSLARLASPLALLAREAEHLVGPLPRHDWGHAEAPEPPQRPTVVFVHRGAALEA
jgi:hypothetical protein